MLELCKMSESYVTGEAARFLARKRGVMLFAYDGVSVFRCSKLGAPELHESVVFLSCVETSAFEFLEEPVGLRPVFSSLSKQYLARVWIAEAIQHSESLCTR